MLKKIIATATTFGTSLYVFAMPVFADTVSFCDTPAVGGLNIKFLCGLTISGLVKFGIQAILIVALILAFAFLVIGGIKWIISGGDKAGTEAAKGTVTAALIGLVIVFLSWMFLNLVLGAFGSSASNPFVLPTIQGSGACPAGQSVNAAGQCV